MTPLFETIVKHVPQPKVDLDGPFQMQVISLDYSSYVGAIAVGRIKRGKVTRARNITVIERDGNTATAGAAGASASSPGAHRGGGGQCRRHRGHYRYRIPHISDTFCDPAKPRRCRR